MEFEGWGAHENVMIYSQQRAFDQAKANRIRLENEWHACVIL